MKLSEIPRDKRVLVIGGSGTGKSHLIGTLCQLLPTLVVTSDPETLDTIASMGLDPDVVLIEDWRKIQEYEQTIARLSPSFPAIAIDDIGSLQTVAKAKVLYMPRSAGESQAARKYQAFQEQVKRELLLGERGLRFQSGDWPSIFAAMETLLMDILDMPFKVKLVTALESVMKSPRDGQDRLYPALDGQLRTVISSHFSLVGELFIEESSGYCATCRSHPKIETKSRYGKGRTWVNPDMAEILAYMNGKGKEETDEEHKIGTGLVINNREDRT